MAATARARDRTIKGMPRLWQNRLTGCVWLLAYCAIHCSLVRPPNMRGIIIDLSHTLASSTQVCTSLCLLFNSGSVSTNSSNCRAERRASSACGTSAKSKHPEDMSINNNVSGSSLETFSSQSFCSFMDKRESSFGRTSLTRHGKRKPSRDLSILP